MGAGWAVSAASMVARGAMAVGPGTETIWVEDSARVPSWPGVSVSAVAASASSTSYSPRSSPSSSAEVLSLTDSSFEEARRFWTAATSASDRAEEAELLEDDFDLDEPDEAPADLLELDFDEDSFDWDFAELSELLVFSVLSDLSDFPDLSEEPLRIGMAISSAPWAATHASAARKQAAAAATRTD